MAQAGTGTGYGSSTEEQRLGTTTTISGADTPGSKASSGIKSALAGIHGLGEKVRGEINGAVDELAGDREGTAKNQAVAATGDRERLTGSFAAETKDREGAVPGAEHGRRG